MMKCLIIYTRSLAIVMLCLIAQTLFDMKMMDSKCTMLLGMIIVVGIQCGRSLTKKMATMGQFLIGSLRTML